MVPLGFLDVARRRRQKPDDDGHVVVAVVDSERAGEVLGDVELRGAGTSTSRSPTDSIRLTL